MSGAIAEKLAARSYPPFTDPNDCQTALPLLNGNYRCGGIKQPGHRDQLK
jgi:hypothetical protein